MEAPGHGGWGWARAGGIRHQGQVLSARHRKPGVGGHSDPGKAEARFKAGLKAALEFRACLPFIPQAPSGRLQHV